MAALRSPSGVAIREAESKDARQIARLHDCLLPHGFFARLGPRYLAVYHQTFMKSPHAVSLLACRDERIVGMIAGALDAGAHQRHTLRRHGPRLAAAGAAALLRRPALAREFVTTRSGRYARGAARAVKRSSTPLDVPTEAPPPSAIAVLTHVAVDPGEQGCGTGSSLVEEFIERVRRSGGRVIELVTLADDGASPFYERLGWTCVGEHVREGRTYRRFRLELA